MIKKLLFILNFALYTSNIFCSNQKPDQQRRNTSPSSRDTILNRAIYGYTPINNKYHKDGMEKIEKPGHGLGHGARLENSLKECADQCTKNCAGCCGCCGLVCLYYLFWNLIPSSGI